MLARVLIACALLAFVSRDARAQDAPPRVVAFAQKQQAACEKFDGKAKAPAAQQIGAPAMKGNVAIYVVDAAKTGCGDDGPLCGTGGCMTAVFRVSGASVKQIYAQQTLGWKVVGDTKIMFDVHGSRCGGAGPDRCVTELDLFSGKERTFKPKDAK